MTATATVAVASASGLHARPASLFAQAVAKTGHAVTIQSGDKPAVNAASLIALLTLGAGHGAEVELGVTGEREDEVLAELRALLESDLDAA